MKTTEIKISDMCPAGKGEVIITVYGYNPPKTKGYKVHHAECDSNDFWTNCHEHCSLINKYNHFIF